MTECFNAHFKRLIARYDQTGVRCVFWVDHCGIHNAMESIVENTRHCVGFNAAYSPEVNQIENMFGVWKQQAEWDVRSFDGLQGLLEKIVAEFETIEQNVVSASFELCRNEVWPKAYAMEDL